MKTGSRVFLLIGLCFFVAGCSGYRITGLGTLDEPGRREGGPDVGTIHMGDKLRVTMTDGRAYRGKFVSSIRDTLTLQEEWLVDEYQGYGTPVLVDHVLPVAQVETVERYESSNGGLIVLGIGLVVVTAVVIGKSIQDSLDWGDGLFSEAPY